MPEGETRVFVAVCAAFPFLAVRTVYTILADFENDATFGILDGNAFVQLGMAVVEEMIVTVIFIVVGVMAPRFGEQVQKHGQGLVGGKPSVQVRGTVGPAYV